MVSTAFKKLFIVPALAAVLLFNSCSTDVDLLEAYKPITVVYGLLNIHDSIQYIKVNKAFLGEGNALLMAQQGDSVNYQPGELNVQLQKINPLTGEVLQTIVCDTTTQIMKDPGLFSNPYQILYMTATPLDENSSYKLVINRSADGAVVTAVTPIVNNVTVTNPDPLLPNTQIPFYNGNTQTYLTYSLRWKHSADAAIYSASLRFTYYDSLLVAPFTKDTVRLEMTLGDVSAGSSAVGATKEIKISGQDFFNLISSSVQHNPNVFRYTDGYVDISLSAGTEDLQTYIDIYKPSIGLIQEKPSFTNISNGTGIFSSRWTTTLTNKLTQSTVVKANEVLNP